MKLFSRRGFVRLFVLLGIGSVFFAAMAVALWYVNPVQFRLKLFQPVRELRLAMKELEPIRDWEFLESVESKASLRVTIPAHSRDQLNIVADLWLPQGRDKAPAILLLHGSAPWGRKAGLIQLLGHELHERGWVVLAPDARGFGDTADPAEINSPSSWSVESDIDQSLTFIGSLSQVDPHRIYVLGHSLGANHALEGALNDERVNGIVLMGPSRFLDGGKAALSHWGRVRFAADRRLAQPIPEDVARASLQRSNIAWYAENTLAQPGHTPILLMDGEEEGRANLAFLGKVVDKIAPPIEYVTVENTGHYCGVWNFFGSQSLYVNRKLFDRCFGKIVAFIGTRQLH